MKAINFKKYLLVLLITLISINSANAAMSLSDLVKAVKKSATESSAENKQRLIEFKGKRDEQQRLLTNAKNTL